MENFNPCRLKFARKRRKLSIKDLSSKLGITSKTLSDYENGRREPPPSVCAEIAKELQFRNHFFFMDSPQVPEPTAVSFRSLARMSASLRDSAINAGAIALEINAWLEEKFELPFLDLPDLRDYLPESAAEAVRSAWGLGELPIRNMVHLLEAKGVRVFSLSENTHDMDAYSFWMNDRPFIFLNTKKSVEHGRFDAAHELGHLVLHKHGAPLGKEAESQAHRFASALLMPAGSINSKVPRYPTLKWVIAAKSFWVVSAAALVRRMKDLAFLTEWQYRRLIVDLSSNGYLKREPNAASQRETSKLLPMLFKALRGEGITKENIAEKFGIYTSDINSLLFNLTITGLDGRGKESNTTPPKSPSLRRIK